MPSSVVDFSTYEAQRHAQSHIIGADEVGRGAWAGPLLVCAAAVPHDWVPPRGLDDSKKLEPWQIEDLFHTLKPTVPYACATISAKQLDQIGMNAAIHSAFRTCLLELRQRFPDALVVLDGDVKVPEVPHLSFPKADGLVHAVMAASVIAKFVRDTMMVRLGEKYPGYGLGDHAGYGTAKHKAALDKKGPCPEHRMSFLPLKKFRKDDVSVEEEGLHVDET